MMWPFNSKKHAEQEKLVDKALERHDYAKRRLEDALAHARGEQINTMIRALVPRKSKEGDDK